MALWAVWLPMYLPYAGLRAYWQKQPCCARRFEQHDADGAAPPMMAAAHTTRFPALHCAADTPPDPDADALPDDVIIATTTSAAAATTRAAATAHIARRPFATAFSDICVAGRVYRANNWSGELKCEAV